jgi:hypothetical protein
MLTPWSWVEPTVKERISVGARRDSNERQDREGHSATARRVGFEIPNGEGDAPLPKAGRSSPALLRSASTPIRPSRAGRLDGGLKA